MKELVGVASNPLISLETEGCPLMLEVVFMTSEPVWMRDADGQLVHQRSAALKTLRFAATTEALRSDIARLGEHVEHAEKAHEAMQSQLRAGATKDDNTGDG